MTMAKILFAGMLRLSAVSSATIQSKNNNNNYNGVASSSSLSHITTTTTTTTTKPNTAESINKKHQLGVKLHSNAVSVPDRSPFTTSSNNDMGDWTKKLNSLEEMDGPTSATTQTSSTSGFRWIPSTTVHDNDNDEMSRLGLLSSPKNTPEEPNDVKKDATKQTHQQLRGRRRRRMELDNSPSKRPIMYTFFTGVGSIKLTGMTTEADNDLLAGWKQEWSRMGWEPRVIGVDVAQQHPHFALLNDKLTETYNDYERYCFLRWLAMSVVGGGWMSDYDTFPLYPFDPALPNGGRLTVHEHSKRGGVPDLLSGSANEFLRMAIAIVNNTEGRNDGLWSDMVAMHDVYMASNGTEYIMEPHVVPGHTVLKKRVIDEQTCRRTQDKYAIHFSHFAMAQATESSGFGSDQEKIGPQQRAKIALNWLRQWRELCVEDESDALLRMSVDG